MLYYLIISSTMPIFQMCALFTRSCLMLCNPIDRDLQALSMGFSRKQYWRGLPFPSPRDLPDPGIKPGSPALQVVSCIAGIFFTDRFFFPVLRPNCSDCFIQCPVNYERLVCSWCELLYSWLCMEKS